MKNIILLFLLTASTVTVVDGQSKYYDYAYIKNNAICVYSIAEKKEYTIAKHGYSPSISPNGKKLVYEDGPAEGKKIIKIVDLDTKKISILNTHSNNCYSPVWSPDGKLIAYKDVIGVRPYGPYDTKASVAIVGTTNAYFKLLEGKMDNCSSLTWLGNSKNIAVQDFKQGNILVSDLSGNIIKEYALKDLSGGIPELKDMPGNSSGDEYILTSDNKKIVFSCGDEGTADGPLSGVFIYDIASKKTLRLSPKGYDADQILIKGNNVLFSASKRNSSKTNIYSVDMSGGDFKMIFLNCTNISAKN